MLQCVLCVAMFIQYLILHNLDSVDSLYVNDTLAIMLESKSSHDGEQGYAQYSASCARCAYTCIML